MAISKDNTRIIITIPKGLKEKVEMAAKLEQRSISNLCCKVLTDYVSEVLKNENSNLQS